MNPKDLTIKITGEGYNIEEKIDKVQLSRILPFIVSSEDTSLDNVLPISAPSSPYLVRRRPKPQRRISSTPVTIRAEIESLDIDPVSEQYGNYWKIDKKGDRLLWILANLNEKNIQSVNLKELSFIATKLNDNIQAKGITALLDFHKKEGRIAPSLEGSTRTVRILKHGLDYIKTKGVTIGEVA